MVADVSWRFGLDWEVNFFGENVRVFVCPSPCPTTTAEAASESVVLSSGLSIVRELKL